MALPNRIGENSLIYYLSLRLIYVRTAALPQIYFPHLWTGWSLDASLEDSDCTELHELAKRSCYFELWSRVLQPH